MSYLFPQLNVNCVVKFQTISYIGNYLGKFQKICLFHYLNQIYYAGSKNRNVVPKTLKLIFNVNRSSYFMFQLNICMVGWYGTLSFLLQTPLLH